MTALESVPSVDVINVVPVPLSGAALTGSLKLKDLTLKGCNLEPIVKECSYDNPDIIEISQANQIIVEGSKLETLPYPMRSN